jgi:hypothetical protein
MSVAVHHSAHSEVRRHVWQPVSWLRFRRRRVTRQLAGLGSVAPLMAGSRTWSRPASTVDTRAWMT